MALRVHDLAKELKISSAALMKHLKDMAIEVKSHMKYLDDEVADKVRQKFKQEVEQIKKLESERKLIQEQLRNKEKKDKDVKDRITNNPFKDIIITHEETPIVSPFSTEIKAEEKDTKPEIINKEKSIAPQTKPDRKIERPYKYDDRDKKQEKIPNGQYRQDGRHTRTEQRNDPREKKLDRPFRQDDRYNRTEQRGGNHEKGYDNRYRMQSEGTYTKKEDPPFRQQPRRDNNNVTREWRPEKRDDRYLGTGQKDKKQDSRTERPFRQDTRNDKPFKNVVKDKKHTGTVDEKYVPRGPKQYDNTNPRDREKNERNHRYTTQNKENENRAKKPPEFKTFSQTGRQKFRNDNKEFKKSDSTSTPYTSQRSTDKHSPKVLFPKSGIVKLDNKEFTDKQYGKDKVSVDELGDKSKHIQAKLKNTKRRDKSENIAEIDETALEKKIKLTLSTTKKKKKYKKEEKKNESFDETAQIRLSEFTSVSELAKIIDVTPSEIIMKFLQMGKMVSINQRLDKDSIELICAEFNLEISFQDDFGIGIIQDTLDDLADIIEKPRPPVVTIMGHVDHGKTSILDRIRNTKVAHGESGGITQHIGAYQAVHNGQKVTFIDTPGHEAFTAMRARGANITDIAVIVVAANDGVKPQTIEAIDHARAAGVTMVIAINKVDLPDANIDKTVSSLLEQSVYLEGFGGQIPWVKCSAINGNGIDELIEIILLSAEMKELKARFNGPGKGIVIESEKNNKVGSKATILLQEGSLNKGDNIVVGSSFGHVRKMENERTLEVFSISPADIAVVYGLNDVPKAGDILNVVENEKIARQIGGERLLIRKEIEKYQSKTNLGNLFTKIKQNEMTDLRLLIKGDVDGSVEAVCDSLQKLSTDEIKISIIRKSVGSIIEADVNLASASDAIIIGFNVRANNRAKKLAEESGVEIKFYQIIFECIDDIKKAMIGMLSPEFKERIVGQALVKQIFKMKKLGNIAGCAVEKGTIQSRSKIRLYRDDKVIFTGEMESLRHYQDEVKEVISGTECGITIKNYNDIKEGDLIECYVLEEIERVL